MRLQFNRNLRADLHVRQNLLEHLNLLIVPRSYPEDLIPAKTTQTFLSVTFQPRSKVPQSSGPFRPPFTHRFKNIWATESQVMRPPFVSIKGDTDKKVFLWWSNGCFLVGSPIRDRLNSPSGTIWVRHYCRIRFHHFLLRWQHLEQEQQLIHASSSVVVVENTWQ